MTETTRSLLRLGRPHAQARALAALLVGAGVALAAAAAGVRLAPHLAAVLGAWAAIAAALAGAGLLARRSFASAAASPLARAAEAIAGARSGSVAALLAARPGLGASTALFAAADQRATAVVGQAAPVLTRDLGRATIRGLVGGVLAVALGAALFVAAAPAAGRAEGFWRPWRVLSDARAAIDLDVDRVRVRRGETVTAVVTAPGVASGTVTLWTRGPGEPWRASQLALDSTGRGMRHLGPLESDLWVRASSGARRTPEVRVAVAIPAFLGDLTVLARFPAYLNRAEEPLPLGTPSDTVALPVGTELVARGTASVRLAAAAWRPDSGAGVALRAIGSRFEGEFTPARGGVWRLTLATADGSPVEGPLPTLTLRLVPDSAPVVIVPVPGRDTTLPLSLVQPLVIDVRDDHGVTRLALVSWRVSQTGKVGEAVRETLDVSGVGDRAIVQGELNAERRGLLPGDTLRFWVEARDNAPTPHEGRSPEYALRLRSREELRDAQRAATASIMAATDSVAAAQRSLSERTTDLAQERSREAAGSPSGGRQPATPSGTLPFQASERAQELARQQEAVAERVRDLAKAVDELARSAQAAGIDDTAFQARLAEVQQMLERALTPELEQRLRDLQAALARLDPEAMREALRRLAEAQQQLRETLERSEQLFRRAAVEGQLASLAQDAEELQRDQGAWNRDAARRTDSAAAAMERELAGRADSLASGIAQAERDLDATRRSAADSGALARPQAQARRAQGAMQRAAERAERSDAQGAVAAGEAAERALDSLPESLRARRDSVAQSWRQEAIDALDRALSETAALAERQRSLTAALESDGSPAAARAQQAAIEEGTEAVGRQIRDAAGRHALVSPGLESALGFAQRQMGASRQQLEQAQPNTEGAAQLAGEALAALNATAYALAQSRADVAGARSGSGFQEAMERLAQLASQQQGLNQDAMGLMPMAGTGDQVMQQLRGLAARQRALAEQLERLRATGGSSAAGPLAEEARELARQMEAGRIDRQTIARQERLYRRLLDAGRTLTGPEPDQEKERTSRAATGDSLHLPTRLPPGATDGPRVRYPTWRELEGLTPEQRRLVLEYFRLLNAPR